jgi:hypothetical protein
MPPIAGDRQQRQLFLPPENQEAPAPMTMAPTPAADRDV